MARPMPMVPPVITAFLLAYFVMPRTLPGRADALLRIR